MKLRLIGALGACLMALSFNVNAVIVDNGTYTTVNGYDWLDLTETADMSYNQVSLQLGAGGTFEGWSYAARDQVKDFWSALGGNLAYYDGWSTQNNGKFDYIASFWGDVYCMQTGCTPGQGYSFIITGSSPDNGLNIFVPFMYDLYTNSRSAAEDYFLGDQGKQSVDWKSANAGSALYRLTAVPLPGAAWLLGSGLLALFGVASRKARDSI